MEERNLDDYCVNDGLMGCVVQGRHGVRAGQAGRRGVGRKEDQARRGEQGGWQQVFSDLMLELNYKLRNEINQFLGTSYIFNLAEAS